MLTDHLCNVQSKAILASSEHDVFTCKDIREFVEHCSEVMTLGQWTNILCFLQVSGWYQTVLREEEEMQSEESIQGEEGAAKNPVFEGKA